MGNPANEKSEQHAGPSANEKSEKNVGPSASEKRKKHGKPSRNEKSENKAGPSAPEMKEMPEDERPEESELNSSTVIFRPGLGFSVTNNLKPFNESLSVVGIKKMLIEYTEGTWFKSSSKAKNIEIVNVEYSWAHVYSLQCYNQKRQIKEKYCQYRGGRLDDESLGEIPGMWDIQPAFIPEDFQKSKEKVRMPHSETVRICWYCDGDGYVTETTSYTDSDGDTHTETRDVTCSTCGGNGSLLYHLQLNIEWVPTVFDYVASDSKINKKKLRLAAGHYIFENKDIKVLPVEYLGSSLCTEVTQYSADALAKHEKTLKINQISIRQRQTIKVVPIAECHYLYKKSRRVRTFYLFGKDRKGIYAPSFPSNMACSLM